MPDADRFRILLDGPLVRTLERQSPALEVLANTGLGEADPVQLEDQLAYQHASTADRKAPGRRGCD